MAHPVSLNYTSPSIVSHDYSLTYPEIDILNLSTRISPYTSNSILI